MADPKHQSSIHRIVSGGQTGVDRGALDAAIESGIDHGGWCPRGRQAEDGRIPDRYRMKETDSKEYWVRTERNVIDSDGTLILYRGQLRGGTLFTFRMTQKHQKPNLVVDLRDGPDPDVVRRWLDEHQVRVVNVAGPRESSCPGIAHQAQTFLRRVFGEPG